jgi:long-subunit fatty acid transport protein
MPKMTYMKRKLLITILWLALISLLASNALALENYNGYGGYVIGDQRLVGLAGAYLGKSNDLNAVHYNPAGLIFSSSILDAGLARSQLDNSQTDFDQNGTKDSFPLSYFFGGIVSRTHRVNSCYNIALGLVYDQPYAAEQNFDGKALTTTTLEKYDLRLAISSFSIPVSLQVSNTLAIGININTSSAEEYIRMKYPVNYLGSTIAVVDIDDEQEVSATTIDLGILYKYNERLSIGAVYKPKTVFSFEERAFLTRDLRTGLDADTGIKWYRNVTLPMRVGVGLNYEYATASNIGIDSNYIGQQDNTVLVGSGLVLGMENYEFKEQGVYDLHLGGNYLWNINHNLQLDWRAGTYYEPSRIRKLASRWHYTGGVQINWLYFMVGLGYDKAVDFNNLVTIVALVIRR